ncbi:hypothetical protein ILUMI_09083 [Ignelater luminosus]|uniref:Uncharacterized protein n=1 Tax=Ignelater luminosus TaxID=2038154 RepID=A0A8K0GCT1_IGNLU|nr:hypothetical protein ILUMI_09083 [Ignelater luminosus]
MRCRHADNFENLAKKHVFTFVKENGIQDCFFTAKELVGKKWLKMFYLKHSKIPRRRAQKLCPAKAQKTNHAIPDDYFTKLITVLIKKGFEEKLAQMYNMDEKRCQLTIRQRQPVLAYMGVIRVHLVAHEHGENRTLGHSIPPLLICKGVRIKLKWHISLPAEACSHLDIRIVWLKSVPTANVMSGSRAAGIWPFNPSVIPESAFAPSVLTNRAFIGEVFENAQGANQTSDKLVADPSVTVSRLHLTQVTIQANTQKNDYLHNEAEEKEPTNQDERTDINKKDKRDKKSENQKENRNRKEAFENLDVNFTECGWLTTPALKVLKKNVQQLHNFKAQEVTRKLFSETSANLQLKKDIR